MKVGKYARTNKGDIFIYANAVDENNNKLNFIMKFVNGIPYKYYFIEDEKIVKHSENIKELIELGDIVNWKDNNGYYGINEVITRPETGDILGVYAEEADCLFPLKDIAFTKPKVPVCFPL